MRKKHARLQVDPDVDLMSDGVGVTGNTVSAEQEVLQQIGQVELLKKSACVSGTGQGSVVSEDVWKFVFPGDR